MHDTFFWLKQKTFEELMTLSKRLKVALPKQPTRNRLLSQLHQSLATSKKASVRPASPAVPSPKLLRSPLQERLKKRAEEQLRSPFEALRPERSREIFIDRGLPIPDQYFEDFLELMPISPERIYAYWELSSPKFLNLQDQYGRLSPLILKLQNLSTSAFEVFEVSQEVTEFYFSAKPYQIYQLSLYLLTQQGQLQFLLESPSVRTPAVAPSAQPPEKWLLIEENPAGERVVESGILVETEPRTAVFVPIAPALPERASKTFPIVVQKKSAPAEPMITSEQQKNRVEPSLASISEPSRVPAIRSDPPVTRSQPVSFKTASDSLSFAVTPEKSFDLFSSISKDPEGVFPNAPSEILIYRQEGETEQLWIQEKTGERWFWVPAHSQSFDSWVSGQPVHWIEGKSSAWIRFAPGQGPILRPGKVSWYWGQREGETWFFQEGETTFHQTWLPQPETWSEITPSIRWIEGGQEEGTLVFLEDPTQEFVIKVIEEPYLVIGSSEMSLSSHSWITSLGVPRWTRPLSSWKFPISSMQRIPTSGQKIAFSSRGPEWRRVSIPPSSWNYPVARPEVSSWIFPYRVPKPGRSQAWVPVSSRLESVSSWVPKNWPISSWTQPYLRWVYPEEIWKRPLLNWPSGIGMGSSERVFLPKNSVPSVSFQNHFFPEEPLAKALYRTSWKKIPRKQEWQLPSIDIALKPKKV